MQTLDFIVQPRIAARLSLAEDSHFLHVVGRRSRLRAGTARVYACPGDLLSLGRYHVVPNPLPVGSSVQLHRRHSGGRAIPFGDGFIGFAMVLPHRSALFSTNPFALAPYQVMNRYVRGLLDGLKLVNVAAFYPGRDFVTVDRRVLALVSFAVDPAGALLFEAVIANRRNFSVLPHMLDEVDKRGVIKSEMLLPENMTCLAEELRTNLSTEDVADMLRRGYEKQFVLEFDHHELTPLEQRKMEATAGHESQGEHWIRQRQYRAELDHHAISRVQLGVLEAYFALEQDRFIKEIVLAGDFIANEGAIERLESELRLCPAEWRAIDAIASQIFAQPENFILGIGPLRTITDTIVKGLVR